MTYSINPRGQMRIRSPHVSFNINLVGFVVFVVAGRSYPMAQHEISQLQKKNVGLQALLEMCRKFELYELELGVFDIVRSPVHQEDIEQCWRNLFQKLRESHSFEKDATQVVQQVADRSGYNPMTLRLDLIVREMELHSTTKLGRPSAALKLLETLDVPWLERLRAYEALGDLENHLPAVMELLRKWYTDAAAQPSPTVLLEHELVRNLEKLVQEHSRSCDESALSDEQRKVELASARFSGAQRWN